MKMMARLLRDGTSWNFCSHLFRWPTKETMLAAASLVPELPPQLRVEAAEVVAYTSDPSLQSAYHHLIGSGGCVSPYESQCRINGETGVADKGIILADVAAFYKAFGFNYSKELPEAPDHVAVELAFMGYLKLKQAFAFLHQDDEAIEVCRDAEDAFLQDHLLGWLPNFLTDIARAATHPYYREAAQLAHKLFAFIEFRCEKDRVY